MEILPKYCDLVPGCLRAVELFRGMGIKIGSTSGYTRAMMDLLTVEAGKRGYVPDCTVSASDVPQGRPAPWMCLQNARELGVYPMESIVKIGDTALDIEEGLNAGMWTIGIVVTGNEVGLNEQEMAAISPSDLEAKKAKARKKFVMAGAHFIADSIDECPEIISQINKDMISIDNTRAMVREWNEDRRNK